MKKHCNIPVFIPHLGCPNQCVFCNQRFISGQFDFDIKNVKQTIEETLSTIPRDNRCEIAFFGGSFTGIDYDLMVQLLEIAKEYVDLGRVDSIRCSTRPDYINDNILKTLAKFGVKTIELGIQSTSDRVLSICKRGHTFKDTERAVRDIVSFGFDFVGQMMIGLPGSDLEDEIATADFIINSGAAAARVYPTVVFRSTELCDLTKNKIYVPLSVDDAVFRTASVLEKFVDANVDIIRVGLCATENLSSDKSYFAGPNHPALGELAVNQVYFNRISKKIGELNLNSSSIIDVYVSKGAISKAVGQKRINKNKILSLPYVSDVKFIESNQLSEYEILVQKEDGENKCI